MKQTVNDILDHSGKVGTLCVGRFKCEQFLLYCWMQSTRKTFKNLPTLIKFTAFHSKLKKVKKLCDTLGVWVFIPLQLKK